ncbi:MAG: hypothetical protein KDD56_08645 [Bdellovibrionales bacterium]|nr:hypothetical protein [Bdellovibrionales bacterium]
MKNQIILKSTIALIILLVICLIALPAMADHEGEHKVPQPPPNISSAELNRIKELEGRWETTTSMFGKKDEKVYTEYKVTAGGSAVLETIFPGTPQEMVSLYYDDDNGKLAMTHYCMMRNRPFFSLAESSADKLKLDVTKVEGLKSADDPSMGAVTLNFIDKDHFSSTCQSNGKTGEQKQEPMTMTFTRVE